MKGLLYNEQATYEKNFKKGPPLLSQKIMPHKRNIHKKYKFLNTLVNLPFGIPAGPLLNSKFLKAAFEWGFDVNHYKTQRSVPFACNDFPNILFVDVDGDLTIKKSQTPLVGKKVTSKHPTQFSITNSFGNPSKGPDFWQEDMKKALSFQKEGQLLIASVVGTIQEGFDEEDYFNDFALTAKLANETGVKAIEVNLSCPNVANEGVLCYTPHAVEEICKKTKKAIGNTSLLAKFGYFTPDQQDLLESIVKKIAPYVQGVAAINTISAPIIDKKGDQALPGPNRLKSGVCGASIKWAGLDMTKRLMRLKEKLNYDFAIVGVGGVMTPKDYFDYRKAGADLVQSATGSMWNPNLAYEISRQTEI